MRRGTTVTNIFTTDIDLTSAIVLYVTYKQGNKTVIEKTLEDVTLTADSITLELSQADTLALGADQPTKIQIRARLNDGSAVASNIITTTVGRILKDGVI